MKAKECPRNYGSFDVSCNDCEFCKQGKLYQLCMNGKDHFACAGWNTDSGTYCCIHYGTTSMEKIK